MEQQTTNPAAPSPPQKENLTPEELARIRKYRQIVKLYHFRDYALLYVLLELAISAASAVLMERIEAPTAQKVSLLMTAALLVYAGAVFFGTLHIYLGESSPRLFRKTALPAWVLLLIPALWAGKCGGGVLHWCFLPMKAIAGLYGVTELRSVCISCGILTVLMLTAFLFGCWITNARMYKKIRW